MTIGTLLFLHTVLSLLYSCSAYKLLVVFPIPSRSHGILGEGYVKHLAEAGHEITYITPMPIKTPPQGVRQIDISENKKYLPVEAIFDTRPLMNQEIDLQDVTIVLEAFVPFANETLHINEVQKLINDPKEAFDAVIVEWLYTELFSGLAAVFDCPLIWSSSMEPHSMILSLIDEFPNTAFTFHHLSRDYGFNFWHRLHELRMMFNIRLLKWRLEGQENQIYTEVYENSLKKRGRLLPAYNDVRYNGSLVLANGHVATGEAMSLPQNIKFIGGYHVEKEVLPLPQNLQKILDEAKHGVIYFSLGSILRSDRIPEHLKKEIIDLLGTLNQTVIWKVEQELTDLPKNLHILPWAPQTSILAHPNCILFITHGGLLSETEALHFGVPMIGIPMYADQFININRAERKGFGKKVIFNQDGPKNLILAIQEVLKNYARYRERAKEYSFIHHHRPVPPEKELVHWVEHVVMTRGAVHLRSPAFSVSWYQKYYLDLVAVILILIVVIFRLYKQALVIYSGHLKEKML